MTNAIRSVSLFDWVGIGLAFLFLLLGFCRGGQWQFRRFLGVLLAIAVAGLFAPLAAPVLSWLIDRSRPGVGLGVAYIFLFLFTLGFLSLLFRFLRPPAAKAREAKRNEQEPVPATSKHRGLGVCFGLLTALALYLVLAASMFLFAEGVPEPEFLKNSKGAAVASRLISSLGPCFPLQTIR